MWLLSVDLHVGILRGTLRRLKIHPHVLNADPAMVKGIATQARVEHMSEASEKAHCGSLMPADDFGEDDTIFILSTLSLTGWVFPHPGTDQRSFRLAKGPPIMIASAAADSIVGGH